MKDISIELEEAGLDPFDNSNLQGYVDDTHHFGEDVLTGGFDAPLDKCVILNPSVIQNDDGGLFSRHMIVNGNKHNFIHMNLKAPEGLWVSKRYSYSGRLAKGRLHYDVIDRHTREVVNTYRQVKKAKALVKELNRG